MSHTEIVHIAAQNNAWRVYRPGYEIELAFAELGEALDAAARLVPDGTPVRIILDDAPATTSGEASPERAAG